MNNLFAALFFISLIALIVGLVVPKLVIRWGNYEDRNRKSVLKYYGLSVVAFFILFGITTPEESETSRNSITHDESSLSEDNSSVESVEPVDEEPKAELSDSDKALFTGAYSEFTEEQVSQFSEIQSKYDKLDENVKAEFKPDFDRLVSEKTAFEKAKAEEEARIKAEEKAAEEEAKRQAEAQKYETGLTWEDLARDRDGKIGSYVKFYGRIVQVINGSTSTQYRMAVNSDSNQMILIEIENDKLDNNILEGDHVTIEGMSFGNVTYETVMGAKMTIPGILVENVY